MSKKFDTIDETAARHFGGNLTSMAIANDITPQLLSRWKRKGWLVADGVIMRPHRQLVDSNGNAIGGAAEKGEETPKNES